MLITAPLRDFDKMFSDKKNVEDNKKEVMPYDIYKKNGASKSIYATTHTTPTLFTTTG